MPAQHRRLYACRGRTNDVSCPTPSNPQTLDHTPAGAAQARMANSKCASLAFPRLFPRHPEKMVRIATTSLFYSFSPALHDSAYCKVPLRENVPVCIHGTPKLYASCGFIVTDARPTKGKLWKASCAFASPTHPHRSLRASVSPEGLEKVHRVY